MSEKLLTHVTAGQESDDRWKLTGFVELRATPAWLKGDRLVRARLTPREARKLAVDLLVAADRAEP